MAKHSRTQRVLSVLLPIGVLGASVVLAAAQAKPAAQTGAVTEAPDAPVQGVAERLNEIRSAASASDAQGATLEVGGDPKILLAQWINVGGPGLGWRNGGWRNAGWRNGGWRNWHNGWRNWGNGGWPNFWRNW